MQVFLKEVSNLKLTYWSIIVLYSYCLASAVPRYCQRVIISLIRTSFTSLAENSSLLIIFPTASSHLLSAW